MEGQNPAGEATKPSGSSPTSTPNGAADGAATFGLISKGVWLGLIVAAGPSIPVVGPWMVLNPEAAYALIGGAILTVRHFTDGPITWRWPWSKRA